MQAQRPALAVLSALFLLGYALGGLGSGAIFVALGVFTWAAWPKATP